MTDINGVIVSTSLQFMIYGTSCYYLVFIEKHNHDDNLYLEINCETTKFILKHDKLRLNILFYHHMTKRITYKIKIKRIKMSPKIKHINYRIPQILLKLKLRELILQSRVQIRNLALQTHTYMQRYIFKLKHAHLYET